MKFLKITFYSLLIIFPIIKIKGQNANFPITQADNFYIGYNTGIPESLPFPTNDLFILSNDNLGTVILASTIKFVGTNNAGEPLAIPNEGIWSINQTNGTVSFDYNGDWQSYITSTVSYSGMDINGNTSNISTITLILQANLPLKLLSFIRKPINDKIILSWQTVNETYFSHFEIQRSTNAQKFENIGSVKGNNEGNYSFTDEIPVQGLNYYRLKMIDLDGKFTYSKIVVIEIENDKNISISPNPTCVKANLNLGRKIELLNTMATITNSSGMVVKQLKINKLVEEIDLSTSPKAIYLVKFVDGTVLKLIKE